MKKTLSISVNVIIAVVLIIPLFAFVKNISSPTATPNLNQNSNSVSAAGGNNKVSQTINLTLAEIAKHNQAGDCWMIIAGSVYDITSYVSYHPGGRGMTTYCGQDATEAFNTKGGQGASHSQAANDILKNYYLGKVGSQTNLAPSHPGTTSAVPGNQEREQEDD